MNSSFKPQADFSMDTDVQHEVTVAIDALPVGAPLHDGAYEIVRVLGRGGFGITYEACDTRSKQSVALKEFFPTGCIRLGTQVQAPSGGWQHFEASRRKFLNEAQVLARVQHSNIVWVEDAFKDNNTAYTVMELLHGETLLRRIERGGALSEAEALSIIEHIGSALKTVHELEMLHLDVKPENIFVCPGDELDSEHRVVLMDFDLLQPMAGPASYRTQPLNVTMHCGTPGYAPLEQYTQGTRFGVYTDIYALGATLYHMLIGQPPMDSTDLATRSDTRQADFAPADGVSSAVQKALKWAMQLQPFKRPQSVADFMDALHGRDVATPDTSPQNTATVLRGGTNNSAKLSLTTVASTAPSQAVAAPLKAATAPSIPTTAPTAPCATPMATRGDDLWYIVSVSSPNVEWPWMCACCSATPACTISVRAAAHKYDIPYCAHCSRHVQASRRGVTGGAWGMGTGLVIALSGVMLSNLVLGPLGTMLHFGAMSYWGLQHSFAHDLATSQCSDTRLAVEVSGEPTRRRWRFRNARFRDEFRSLNTTVVI